VAKTENLQKEENRNKNRSVLVKKKTSWSQPPGELKLPMARDWNEQ